MRWRVLVLLLPLIAGFWSSPGAEQLFDADAYKSRQHWVAPSQRMEAEADAAWAGTSVDGILKWLDAHDPARAEALSRELGVSMAAPIVQTEETCYRFRALPSRESDRCFGGPLAIFLGDPSSFQCTYSQARAADISVYLSEKDYAEAQGMSLEEFLAQRGAQEKACALLDERERQAAEMREAIALTLSAIVVVGTVALVFLTRRRIGSFISRWWQRKSIQFRVWLFGTVFWGLAVVLFVGLFDPYDAGFWTDAEGLHMATVMAIPPLFLGASWVCYKRMMKKD